ECFYGWFAAGDFPQLDRSIRRTGRHVFSIRTELCIVQSKRMIQRFYDLFTGCTAPDSGVSIGCRGNDPSSVWIKFCRYHFVIVPNRRNSEIAGGNIPKSSHLIAGGG